jgi:hypothetical protein
MAFEERERERERVLLVKGKKDYKSTNAGIEMNTK